MTKLSVDNRGFKKDLKRILKNVDEMKNMSFEVVVSGTEEEIEKQLNQYLEEYGVQQINAKLSKGLK